MKRVLSPALIENSPNVLETNSDINLRKSKLIEVRKRINSTKSEINKYGLLNTE
ncbi:conserved hypothetical protein [Magpiepox virus]|nr:conserved hypothetical protein [Magpiepox virus]